MNPREGGKRPIAWQSVITVISAAILIGAEVFGAAFAGGWAVASYSEWGFLSTPILFGLNLVQILFFLCGIAIMVAFIRNAQRVEPFTRRG
jgi:hypothetical protein